MFGRGIDALERVDAVDLKSRYLLTDNMIAQHLEIRCSRRLLTHPAGSPLDIRRCAWPPTESSADAAGALTIGSDPNATLSPVDHRTFPGWDGGRPAGPEPRGSGYPPMISKPSTSGNNSTRRCASSSLPRARTVRCSRCASMARW